jgi:hypothetical protein
MMTIVVVPALAGVESDTAANSDTGASTKPGSCRACGAWA